VDFRFPLAVREGDWAFVEAEPTRLGFFADFAAALVVPLALLTELFARERAPLLPAARLPDFAFDGVAAEDVPPPRLDAPPPLLALLVLEAFVRERDAALRVFPPPARAFALPVRFTNLLKLLFWPSAVVS
jgi:hypothetical protein